MKSEVLRNQDESEGVKVRALGAGELGITAVSNANLLSGRQLEALTQQTGLPYSSPNPVSLLEKIGVFET